MRRMAQPVVRNFGDHSLVPWTLQDMQTVMFSGAQLLAAAKAIDPLVAGFIVKETTSSAQPGADRQLVHIDIGRVQHRAARPHGDNG